MKREFIDIARVAKEMPEAIERTGFRPQDREVKTFFDMAESDFETVTLPALTRKIRGPGGQHFTQSILLDGQGVPNLHISGFSGAPRFIAGQVKAAQQALDFMTWLWEATGARDRRPELTVEEFFVAEAIEAGEFKLDDENAIVLEALERKGIAHSCTYKDWNKRELLSVSLTEFGSMLMMDLAAEALTES